MNIEKKETVKELTFHVGAFEKPCESLEIFDGLSTSIKVLEDPEENLMLVGCGCSARSQRVDQETQ